MLVLERKEGESLTITHQGETLALTVTESRDGKARLAFDGPESFEIWREEVPTE